MINLTDKLLIVTKDKKVLRKAIVEALLHTEEIMAARFGRFEGKSGELKNKKLGFSRSFPRSLISKMNIADSHAYVRGAFDLVNTPRRQRLSTFGAKSTATKKAPSLVQLGNVRQGLSFALMRLWSKGHILFPLNFLAYVHSHYVDLAASQNAEVALYFRNLALGKLKREESQPGLRPQERKSLLLDGQRLFWATDWHSFEDIDLQDLARAQAAIYAVRLGAYEFAIPNFASIPSGIILNELKGPLARRVKLSQRDYENYATTLDNEMRKYRIRRTFNGGANGSDNESLLHPDPNKLTDQSIIEFLQAASVGQGARQHGWLGVDSSFPSLQFLKVPGGARDWVSLLNEFLSHWDKRFESRAKRKALSAFSDYLFVYLPWWCLAHPDSNVKYPSAPKDFNRYVFAKTSIPSAEDSNNSPLTRPLPFLSFVEKLFSTKTPRGIAQKAAFDFFQYLEEEYGGSSSPEIRERFGDEFANPFKEHDVHHEDRSKAIRAERLPHRVYLYLRKYMYAIESYLTVFQEVTNGSNEQNPYDQSLFIDIDKFDLCCPFVTHAGAVHPITTVPTAYLIFAGPILMREKEGKTRAVDRMITLSPLRLLILMGEVGLRGAAARYLDRITFSKFETGDSELFAKQLYVNTDKTRPKPYTTWVTPSVWDVLLREQTFASAVVDQRFADPVPYMGRSNSRFAPVYPLFLGAGSAKYGWPVNDSTYRIYWKLCLYGFQIWYNSITGEKIELVVRKPGCGDGAPQNLRDLETNWTTIYTPHSLRATVISERTSIMPFDLNAELVGQTSATVAAYYAQPDIEELSQTLELSAQLLDHGWGQGALEKVVSELLVARNRGYIHPSDPNSSLRQAVHEDRMRAAEKHGFISIGLMNQSEVDSELGTDAKSPKVGTGLDLLKDVSANQLSFWDTHICPCDDDCPAEVLPLIFQRKRCGLCPYAIKSLDNLPAIQAKKHQLESRARTAKAMAQVLRDKGAAEVEIQENLDQADLDMLEAIGWHIAEHVLLDKHKKLRDTDGGEPTIYQVNDPVLLREKVVRIALPGTEVDRLLQRLGEANAYPSLQDQEIQEQARRIKRIILRQEEDVFAADHDPITMLCASLKNMLDVKRITIEQLTEALHGHRKEVAKAIERIRHQDRVIPALTNTDGE